jgi:hypothetical protein
VLVSQRVCGKIEEKLVTEHVGELSLKGFSRAIPAYNVVSLKS